MKKKVSFVEWQGAVNNNQIFNNKNNWEYSLKNILNKNNISIDSSDVLNPVDADYVIFFDNLFYKNLNVIWDLYYNKKLDHSVYIDFEPPTGHCKNHDKRGIKHLSNIFNKVITFNDDFIGENIVKGNIADFYCDEKDFNFDFKNRKFLAMVTNNTKKENVIGILNFYNSSDYYNNKNIHNHSHSIYHMRGKAVQYFFESCPKDFDLYGTLWDEKYSSILKGYIKQENKYDVLSSYKFIISFDSFVNQKGYISEKIFDCFMAKTVPVYLGADNVCDYIPENCFIDMKKIDSFKDLEYFLRNIDEDRYNEYIKNIESFLKSNLFLEHFSSKASANIIYNALIDDSNNFSYKKAYKSLMYFQRKKNKVLKKKKINFLMSNSDEHNYIQLEFSIYDYLYDVDSDIDVYINGKIRNDIEVKKIVSNDNIFYQFFLDLYYEKKDYVIQVKYSSKNKSKWLRLVDLTPSYSKIYGVSCNKSKTKLFYYSINSKHGYLKAKTLFKYNKKEFWICVCYYLKNKSIKSLFINLIKSNNFLYRIILFFKRFFNKFIKIIFIILKRLKRIIINFLKLPKNILKEIKNVFE